MGVNRRIWTKISTTPAGSCITDSLSHTTYVETNKHFGLQNESVVCFEFVRHLKAVFIPSFSVNIDVSVDALE